jgi:hypothetical protein
MKVSRSLFTNTNSRWTIKRFGQNSPFKIGIALHPIDDKRARFLRQLPIQLALIKPGRLLAATL